MKRQFGHKEVTRIFPGLKPRTLIYWSERGLVKPDFGDAEGRGSRRQYSYANLFEIAFAEEMLSHGVTFGIIEMVMGEVRSIAKTGRFEGFFRIDRSFDVKLGGYYQDWGCTSKEQIETNVGILRTSTILISIESIKQMIDTQIEKLGLR